MISIRVLTHEDYNDILDICKNIWNGTDYLPKVFHHWVDDKAGVLIGAVDTETNKVIGNARYSVLSDGTGWLEGIRIHKDYRGRKIAKLMTDYILDRALKDLKAGKISKVAFATHISNVESITMMKQYDFIIEQQHILVTRDFEKLNPVIKEADYVVKPWDVSYKTFANLPFTRRRDGMFNIAFLFQRPTPEFFQYLKDHDAFININGCNGIYLFKGEPYFVTEEESFQAIDTFMNYYALKLKGNCYCPPLFSVLEQDKALIEQLKAAGYGATPDWTCDYYYFARRA